MNYSKIAKEFAEDFFKLVENSQNIILTSHFAPDGDSISSVLSVYRIIRDKYKEKKVKIVYSNKIDENFSSFQNFDKIVWVEDMTEHIKDCDLLIVLDCGTLNRFTLHPEKLKDIKNTICIDHHASTPGEFTLSAIMPSIPSCSEVVFRLFENHMNLDKNLSEIVLLGILSDTGNFTFLNSSQSETFAVAQKLIKVGDINLTLLRERYAMISKREYDLLQEFVKNSSFGKVEGWPLFHFTFIDRDVVEKGGYSSNEVVGASRAYIAGYLTSIKGYKWGFILRPKSSYCGVSMRSLPGVVNVRDILERMSLGSGHDMAAGGIFKRENDSLDPKVCIEQIINWMKNNKPTSN